MGWISADQYVREHTARQIETWNAGLDFAESLMGYPGQRGGGLMGGTPLMHQVRDGLVRDGLLALEYERLGRRI